MAFHVDVVKNDWLAGVQYPLATIKLDDTGAITVDAQHPDRWEGLAADIRAEDDATQALSELHTKINGSHLFATEPHDESECPFHGHPVYLHGAQPSRAAAEQSS